MLSYENQLKEKGYKKIGGIDEVGRGCLAGDVVACVVVVGDSPIEGIKDSKKLSEKKREQLYSEITTKWEYAIGVATYEEIDNINIKNATKLAMKRAVEQIENIDYLLIDAETIDSTIDQQGIIKGDTKSMSIAAASIVAKVTRDRQMKNLSDTYPEYLFYKNKGYGTKEHRDALKTYGACKIHRKTFLSKII